MSEEKEIFSNGELRDIIVLMTIVLLTGCPLLRLLFGRYSYPALAVYNAGAAFCRSKGKTKLLAAEVQEMEGFSGDLK